MDVDTNLAINDTPEWKALHEHYENTKDDHIRDMFAADPQRFSKFSLKLEDILFDFSKNRVNEDTMKLLRNLAVKADVQGIEFLYLLRNIVLSFSCVFR